MALFLFFQQQEFSWKFMCQCDTYDPCLGLLYEEKNIIRMRPRVRKGRTDKGDVSIFICMYFIFHAGKSGSLNISASEGS